MTRDNPYGVHLYFMTTLFSDFSAYELGIIASLITGLSTGLGALFILFTRKVSGKLLDGALSIAAGVMMASTSFSLVIPAIESAGGGLKGAFAALVGILTGAVFLDMSDKFLPKTGNFSGSMRGTWLFIATVTIHNFPEGLAVGIGFSGGNIPSGMALALGIAIQNIPEGLAVALPLLRFGYPKWKAIFIAFLTGLTEPLGGLLGVSLLGFSSVLLPFTMAFAAGAMLFVICHEIIPEAQSSGDNLKFTSYCIVIGFVIMMFLDNCFN